MFSSSGEPFLITSEHKSCEVSALCSLAHGHLWCPEGMAVPRPQCSQLEKPEHIAGVAIMSCLGLPCGQKFCCSVSLWIFTCAQRDAEYWKKSGLAPGWDADVKSPAHVSSGCAVASQLSHGVLQMHGVAVGRDWLQVSRDVLIQGWGKSPSGHATGTLC